MGGRKRRRMVQSNLSVEQDVPVVPVLEVPEEVVVAIKNNLNQVVMVPYRKGEVDCHVTLAPSGSVECDKEVFDSPHYVDLMNAGVVQQIQSFRRK